MEKDTQDILGYMASDSQAMRSKMLRERIAEEAHLTWQRWMGYMLTNLDDEHIERWKRQANTAYKDLSETEKESDRAIADRYLTAIREAAEEGRSKRNPHWTRSEIYKKTAFDEGWQACIDWLTTNANQTSSG